MSETERILEKCTGKELPFCQAACPLHVDMKGANALIREGKFGEALDLIRERLPFPGIMGNICTHPCENACRRKNVDEPISIMHLKKSAADYGTVDWDLTIVEEKKGKIAVVGGGPAGLMAAYNLRRFGYQVTIFEALSVLGGMLAFAIPAFRLPRLVLQGELDILKKIGIEVKLNTKIGEHLNISRIKQDFEAVFIATGTPLSRQIPVEGAQLDGVSWGLDFLRDSNLGREVRIKDRVVVVGGGNVAIDVALTALRLGAQEVQLACLESEETMPAFAWEVSQALEEGIKLNVCWGPKRILGDGHKVKGIELVRCTSVLDESGRFNPSFDESSTVLLDTDMVILAIGQAPDTSFLKKDGQVSLSQGNYIVANNLTLETSVPGIFAGGDVVTGPKSVVDALAAGRKAAISIDRYLRGEDLNAGRQSEGPVESRLKVETTGVSKKSRVRGQTQPVSQRKGNFLQIESGFSPEEAREEAERCLACECGLCVKECPFLELYGQTPGEMAENFKTGNYRETPAIPYSCNLCELCKKVCPETLCSADMFLEMREKMVAEGAGPLPEHEPVRASQEWATSDAFALNKSDPRKGPGEWVFFPGCSLSAYSPTLVLQVYDYLRERLPGTGLILNCCGAPTHCLGDHHKFAEIEKTLESVVKGTGATGMLVGCPDCYRTIKRNTPGIRLKSIYEVFVEQGLPDGAKALESHTFSLHDSCTARDEIDLMNSVRELVKRMGYQIGEMEYHGEKTRCCGAGGMVPYVDLGLYFNLAERRANEAPFDILTYCAMCRETFAVVEKPAIHILDLIFNRDWQTALYNPPQIGDARQERQAETRELLLKSGNQQSDLEK